MTPTLTLYYPNEREETNRVLRKFKKYKDFFFRLILMSDSQEKIHFGSNKEREVLYYLKDVMKDGLNIGDCGSEVLNYSNSQLKNHSVWMICKTKIPEIQTQAIIKSLGEFNSKKGYLLMFARRGQCFSTTKNICSLTELENVEYIDDIERPKYD